MLRQDLQCRCSKTIFGGGWNGLMAAGLRPPGAAGRGATITRLDTFVERRPQGRVDLGGGLVSREGSDMPRTWRELLAQVHDDADRCRPLGCRAPRGVTGLRAQGAAETPRAGLA
ncbi:hypothetical protein GCM10010245_67380 [Streptomyces spectabilis]|nr:hypothetical protein GCM10010245_67380 [Streptomyces spectabilis]